MNQMDFNSRPQNFSRRMPGTMAMPNQQAQPQPGGIYVRPLNNGGARPMGGGNFAPRPGMNPGMNPGMGPAQGGYGNGMQGGMAPGQGGYANGMNGSYNPGMNGGYNNGMAPMQGGGMAPMQGGYGRRRNFRTENINAGETIVGMDRMTPNGERWDQVRLGDVRDNLSKEEADARLDQLDDFMEQMKGTVDLGVASPGNVDQIQSSIRLLVELLLDPNCWLPTDVIQNHRDIITKKGAIVAKNLWQFGNAIAIATRTNQLPPIEELMPQSRDQRRAAAQQQGAVPQQQQVQQQVQQPVQPQYPQQQPYAQGQGQYQQQQQAYRR